MDLKYMQLLALNQFVIQKLILYWEIMKQIENSN